MTDPVERQEPFVSTMRSGRADYAAHSVTQPDAALSHPADRVPPAGARNQAMADRIRHLEAENRRLQRLSITDELTSAFNRRHFRTSYQALLDSPPRPSSVALCLFDIDRFKAYNDSFGHPMGDAALRAVTLAITPLLRRQSDRLFRFGGDEFGALFSAASADRAIQLVERFQDAVHALGLPHPGGPATLLTATFGLAWHPNPVEAQIDAKQLYVAADRALYQAKEEGRDGILLRAMRAAGEPGEPDILRSTRAPR